MGVLGEECHIVAEGRIRPHHRMEPKDRSSEAGNIPKAPFPATGGCRRASPAS